MKIDTRHLKPGDIIGWRNVSSWYGRAIRAVLGSYTNHNALFVLVGDQWYIGEAVQPVSRLTPLSWYENLMSEDKKNVMCVWRVEGVPDGEREKVNQYFLDFCLGIKYPISVARLWVYRFVNNIPWKIKGKWCTQLVWDSWGSIDPDIFNRPDGKKKLNPTPRTLENRLVAGVITDITDQVIKLS